MIFKYEGKEISKDCNLEHLQKELKIIELEIENASEYVKILLESRKILVLKKIDMIYICNQISEEELIDLYQDEYYKKMGH